MQVPSNEIDLPFGDGVYHFAMPLPMIEELQRKCGGVGGIFSRLIAGRYLDHEGQDFGNPQEAVYRAEDCNEVIRIGLAGGGFGMVGEPGHEQRVEVTPERATQLFNTYCAHMPYAHRWTLAASILGAVIEGFTPPEGAPKPPQKKTAD